MMIKALITAHVSLFTQLVRIRYGSTQYVFPAKSLIPLIILADDGLPGDVLSSDNDVSRGPA